jgi:hypothetical protein
MLHIGETLRKFWLRQGIKLNIGATEELGAFEVKYHVRLPLDLRAYFAAVNGFDGSEAWMADNNVITFLQLDEVKPLGEYWSPELADANSYFVFADYSLGAHVYAIRLAKDSGTGNAVVVLYDSNPIKVANSFSEFVEGYLENNHAILFPKFHN